MEAFIREANALLAMLAEEFGTSPRVSQAELGCILGLVERMREAAASDRLPVRSARTIGLGRPVASHWTLRTLPREQLVSLAQWFFRLGVPGAA